MRRPGRKKRVQFTLPEGPLLEKHLQDSTASSTSLIAQPFCWVLASLSPSTFMSLKTLKSAEIPEKLEPSRGGGGLSFLYKLTYCIFPCDRQTAGWCFKTEKTSE